MSNIICDFCGKQMKRMTFGHLTQHDITMQDYKKWFPFSPMTFEEIKNKVPSNSIECFIKKYGEEIGREKYEEYKKFQSTKNTFEYKQTAYGWTTEQFNEYNNNRSCTKANFIKRHGTELGTNKWNEYVIKQKTHGISLDWFQSKYGIEKGQEVFDTVCKNKSHTMETYVKRYGTEIGPSKYLTWLDKKATFHLSSPMELQFVADIMSLFPSDYKIYSSNTKQFILWNSTTKKPCMYDFVVTSPFKLCIEFNGNYWHCNPDMYACDFFHPQRNITAKQVWNQDKQKQELIESKGYEYMCVWEKDWKDKKEVILKEIQECIHLLQNK